MVRLLVRISACTNESPPSSLVLTRALKSCAFTVASSAVAAAAARRCCKRGCRSCDSHWDEDGGVAMLLLHLELFYPSLCPSIQMLSPRSSRQKRISFTCHCFHGTVDFLKLQKKNNNKKKKKKKKKSEREPLNPSHHLPLDSDCSLLLEVEERRVCLPYRQRLRCTRFDKCYFTVLADIYMILDWTACMVLVTLHKYTYIAYVLRLVGWWCLFSSITYILQIYLCTYISRMKFRMMVM